MTFKETVDIGEQPLSENRCKSIGQSDSNKASTRMFAPLGSCTLLNESKCNKKECDVQSDNNTFIAADNNMVIIPTGSLISSDNVKILDGNVGFADQGKDCFPIQQGECQTGSNDLCDSERDVSNLPSCNKECFNSDLTQDLKRLKLIEGGFTNSQKEYNAKKVENSSKETICDNRNSLEHNSEDNNSRERLGVPKNKMTLSEESGLDGKEQAGNSSSMTENDHLFSENHHWMWLFEEEFPRRSLRIRSTPDLRSKALVCQHNSVKQPIRKAKPIRTKQSRTKKYIPSSGDRTVKSDNEDNLTHGTKRSLLKEKASGDFVFPRPTLEQTKNCGPLAVVVDFSLPDKEFAKLKLAKIKGTLSTERGSKELKNNNVAEKSIVRHVSELEGDAKLPDAKWTKKAGSVDAEKTAQEHTSQMEEDSEWTYNEVNDQREKQLELNTSETEGVSKLPDSKCGQQTKEDCSFALNAAQFVSKLKSREVGNISSVNTLEGNGSEKVKEQSSTVECNKESESTGWSHSSFKLEQKQVDVQLQSTGAKSHEACIFPKEQSQKHTCIETCTLCQFESSHCNCSDFQTVSGSCTSSIDNAWQTDDIEMINKCGPDYCKGQSTSSISNKQDHQSGLLKNGGLSDKYALSKHSTPEKKKEIEFLNQGDSEQQNVQEELSNVTQEKSSSPICNPEPSLGDQATPYGKMKEPLESSQLSHIMSPEESKELSPTLMTACLQVLISLYVLYIQKYSLTDHILQK